MSSAVAAVLICAAVGLGDVGSASAAPGAVPGAVPEVMAEQSPAALTPTPAAAITVTSVSAASITPGSTLVIRGSVRNTGSTRITGMRVGVNLDWPRLDQAGVAAWAARPLTERIGNAWASQSITAAVGPGATVAFTLTARADVLGLPLGADGFGPRGAALEVTGDPGSGNRRLAVQRTFVVWDPKPGTTTSRLSVLVPITPSARAATADAGQPSTALLDDWAPTGRLSRLLTATADTGFGWAVDPSLISAATAAQSPGRTVSVSGVRRVLEARGYPEPGAGRRPRHPEQHRLTRTGRPHRRRDRQHCQGLAGRPDRGQPQPHRLQPALGGP